MASRVKLYEMVGIINSILNAISNLSNKFKFKFKNWIIIYLNHPSTFIILLMWSSLVRSFNIALLLNLHSLNKLHEQINIHSSFIIEIKYGQTSQSDLKLIRKRQSEHWIPLVKPAQHLRAAFGAVFAPTSCLNLNLKKKKIKYGLYFLDRFYMLMLKIIFKK